MSTIRNWSIYFNERSPLPVLLLLSFLGSASAISFSGMWNWSWILLGTIAMTLLFIQLRLADEVKDEEKDRIVNPARPLPRGLLAASDLAWAMNGIIAVLLGLAWWIGIAVLAVATVYAWLMYHEFFIGKILNRFPMLYAISHQLIGIPIYAWLALHADGEVMHQTAFLGWLLAQFGASFAFEIARKLNPNAHPLAGTYLQQYGPRKTALLVLLFAIISGIGAFMAGFGWIATIPILSTCATVILWLSATEQHKRVETWASVNALVVSAGPAILWLIQTWT